MSIRHPSSTRGVFACVEDAHAKRDVHNRLVVEATKVSQCTVRSATSPSQGRGGSDGQARGEADRTLMRRTRPRANNRGVEKMLFLNSS
jgi:hypothetical protein